LSRQAGLGHPVAAKLIDGVICPARSVPMTAVRHHHSDAAVAQLVEQRTFNPTVAGSNPAGGIISQKPDLNQNHRGNQDRHAPPRPAT
jgi:hypothetical protein